MAACAWEAEAGLGACALKCGEKGINEPIARQRRDVRGFIKG
jgi:hypothetical protein